MRIVIGFCCWLAAMAAGDDLRAQPAPAEESRPFEASALIGEHTCKGRNPDGTAYQGEVKIRVKDGLVLMEWNINGKKSYGAGLVEGTGLGVALDDGVAIYQMVPQATGLSLIGLWATEGAKTASEEVIFVGDTDVNSAKFEMRKMDGQYRLETVAPDGSKSEGPLVISGGDMIKKIILKDDVVAQGLVLGDGLAVITPTGLMVFHLQGETAGPLSLSGRALEGTAVSKVTAAAE